MKKQVKFLPSWGFIMGCCQKNRNKQVSYIMISIMKKIPENRQYDLALGKGFAIRLGRP
jgi:hypothetical protein